MIIVAPSLKIPLDTSWTDKAMVQKLPIAQKIDNFQVDDHVVYIFSGPDRTGIIRYLDETLASIIDDEIKLSVSIRRGNIKGKV